MNGDCWVDCCCCCCCCCCAVAAAAKLKRSSSTGSSAEPRARLPCAIAAAAGDLCTTAPASAPHPGACARGQKRQIELLMLLVSLCTQPPLPPAAACDVWRALARGSWRTHNTRVDTVRVRANFERLSTLFHQGLTGQNGGCVRVLRDRRRRGRRKGVGRTRNSQTRAQVHKGHAHDISIDHKIASVRSRPHNASSTHHTFPHQ